jgi:formiminotetrahydrofolate cyclodeaminase
MTGHRGDPQLTAISVDKFLALLASGQPTPGGGSAAALAGAMAAALTGKVARLTIGRSQYAACEKEMLRALDRAEALQSRLAVLAAEDALAYRAVIQAYALPKETEIERARRAAEIQRALRYAVEVPREAAEACGELLELAASCVALGNRNATIDAAVAALLAHAGMRGAALNIRANLNYIRDDAFTQVIDTRLNQVLAAGETALARALLAANLGA